MAYSVIKIKNFNIVG